MDHFIPLSTLPPKLLWNLHRRGLGRIQRFHFSGPVWRSLRPGRNRFLIRVDDFPRLDLPHSGFERFAAIMERKKLPYVLGITPFLRKEGILELDERKFLRQWTDRQVTLALHGFTHAKRGLGAYHGELNRYSDQELIDWMARARAWFAEVGIPFPESLIPPFNMIHRHAWKTVSDSFSVLFGGPASLAALGSFGMGERLSGGLYWPSYFPFYGQAAEIQTKLNRPYFERETIMVITLHWAWEIRDNFQALDHLTDQLAGRVVSFAQAYNWWLHSLKTISS